MVENIKLSIISLIDNLLLTPKEYVYQLILRWVATSLTICFRALNTNLTLYCNQNLKSH
jgi:hypothetical protein